ncbi:nucleoside diphosphate kinase 7 isoform X2 [Heterodontus francisci]|uniref:nucleoside diphosphate kinase 7 isoform X2 n=1 Tax=Heterodontus francisci TaxID=7792 RepID=UPI00355C3701
MFIPTPLLWDEVCSVQQNQPGGRGGWKRGSEQGRAVNMDHEEKFSFIAEWYDTSASLIRRYLFLFYPKDGSIEMFDIKNHRTFLKRTKYEKLRAEDLFVGSIITVYARQLHLVGFGDQYTALKLGSKKQKTLGVIKPSSDVKLGKLIDQLYSSGLVISKAKMTNLTSDLLQYLTCGPAVALEILGDEAISAWKKLIGSPDSKRKESEANVRALYGIDNISNNAHGSECAVTAARELEIFFPSPGRGPSNTAKCVDCTLCIIKPHAIAEGLAGKIMNAIEEWGFNFTALQMFNVERANAEEFLEVYKGVVPEYNDMVIELSSGPCLAFEFQGKDIQKSFRECCGPSDPEIARHLRPRSLRALFGKNKIQNAIHCTDLPEDGVLEGPTKFTSVKNAKRTVTAAILQTSHVLFINTRLILLGMLRTSHVLVIDTRLTSLIGR